MNLIKVLGIICKVKKSGLLIKIVRFFCRRKKELMNKIDNKIAYKVAQETGHQNKK